MSFSSDPESDLVCKVFGKVNGNVIEQNTSDNNNGKSRKKKNKGNDEPIAGKKSTRECIAYKYSNKGKGDLHEAVILSGRPVFLKYGNNGEINAVEQISESSRIIRPPSHEEYPYESYEFANIGEVESYIKRVKNESSGSLYHKAKSIVSKYNDQDQHLIVLLAADIVWSYFQDRFSTTHYLGVFGDNGSGKSTVGDTFEAIGYRPVNMTDPTPANLFRVLGSIEPGQCCIIADEAEKIDQSLEIMSSLKTGYQIKGKIPRINTNTLKQEFFFTYCFKIIIAERSPYDSKAKGVLDRMFTFNTYKGYPQYDIKEVMNPAGDKTRKRLFDELVDFRKLMLVYRLMHFNDPIIDLDIGLDGRDKELCKPVIQLFNNTNAQIEIERALQKFLVIKNQRKETTIEAALYPIITNLVALYGNEISVSQLWEAVEQKIEGKIDEKKPNEYHTSDFGTIYRNTITKIICDKFGAEILHKTNGNLLRFDPQKIAKAGRVYNKKSGIQTKILQNGNAEGNEGSEGSIDTVDFSQNNSHDEIAKEVNNLSANLEYNSQNNANVSNGIDNNVADTSLKPSGLSEPSVKSSSSRIDLQDKKVENNICIVTNLSNS
ncbi:MAG TPA: hypothetical protein VE076_13455, partial [Nitrososphaeraceae archaeon]|nr:hypothetical protein [Nitrososphaeraceae archaeon]